MLLPFRLPQKLTEQRVQLLHLLAPQQDVVEALGPIHLRKRQIAIVIHECLDDVAILLCEIAGGNAQGPAPPLSTVVAVETINARFVLFFQPMKLLALGTLFHLGQLLA
jgi:hypothetical protein